MSKIKTLKSQYSELSLSLLDTIKRIDPSGDKRTYCDLILKLIKNNFNEKFNEHRISDYIRDINEVYEMNESELLNNGKFSFIIHFAFLNEFIGPEICKLIKKLHEFREKKLINNDITKYNSIEEVYADVSIAEIKSMESSLSKMTEMVFEDDEWLIIRPLTYESSKKYGSGTKWCTTSYSNSEYFVKYANGILIYIINKKTGLKVASHAELSSGKYFSLSFWNQKDDRVDSMDSGLPQEILTQIKIEMICNNISNKTISKNKGVWNEEEYCVKEEYLAREFAGMIAPMADQPTEQEPARPRMINEPINIPIMTEGNHLVRIDPETGLLYNDNNTTLNYNFNIA